MNDKIASVSIRRGGSPPVTHSAFATEAQERHCEHQRSNLPKHGSRSQRIARHGASATSLVLAMTGTIILSSLLSSCYSFTGASIPAGIHNIAIPNVEDISGFSEAEIKQALTTTLTNKFIREGSLRVTGKQNADVLLKVTVDQINDQATGVSAGETQSTLISRSKRNSGTVRFHSPLCMRLRSASTASKQRLFLPKINSPTKLCLL